MGRPDSSQRSRDTRDSRDKGKGRETARAAAPARRQLISETQAMLREQHAHEQTAEGNAQQNPSDSSVAGSYQPGEPWRYQTGTSSMVSSEAMGRPWETPTYSSVPDQNAFAAHDSASGSYLQQPDMQAWGAGAHLAVHDTSSSSHMGSSHVDSRVTSAYQPLSSAFDAPTAAADYAPHAGMQAGSSSSEHLMPFSINEEMLNATTPDGRLYNFDVRNNLRPQEPGNNHYNEQNNLRPRDHFDEHDILLARYRIPPEQYAVYLKSNEIFRKRIPLTDVPEATRGAYRDASNAYHHARSAYFKEQKDAGVVEMTPLEMKNKRGNESRAIAKSGIQYLATRGLSIETAENKKPVISTLHALAVEQYNRQAVHHPELQELLQDKNVFTQKMTDYHATVQRYQQTFERHASQREDDHSMPPPSAKLYFDGRYQSYKKDGTARPPNHFYAGILRPRDHFDEHDILLPVSRMSHADHQLYLGYRENYRNK